MSEQVADTRSSAGVRHLPAPERYVARGELAAIMGVSLATVDRMVAEGMPCDVGTPYAPFQAVCGHLLGNGKGEGGVSVMKLPSGRWRAQVHDPSLGHNVSVSRVLGGPGTFSTKTEAKQARERARERLGTVRVAEVTMRDFWQRWTIDPLFARPKESTNIHNRERTSAFVERYGNLRVDAIGGDRR